MFKSKPALTSELYVILFVLHDHSPYDYNDEVEKIPAVSQVGVWVKKQAIGYHLQECFHREDDEE